MDWKEKIKDGLKQRDARRVQIHTALQALVTELDNYLGLTKAVLQPPINDNLLTWTILIGPTEFTINEREVLGLEANSDNLQEALKELITTKFENSLK